MVLGKVSCDILIGKVAKVGMPILFQAITRYSTVGYCLAPAGTQCKYSQSNKSEKVYEKKVGTLILFTVLKNALVDSIHYMKVKRVDSDHTPILFADMANDNTMLSLWFVQQLPHR